MSDALILQYMCIASWLCINICVYFNFEEKAFIDIYTKIQIIDFALLLHFYNITFVIYNIIIILLVYSILETYITFYPFSVYF